MTGWLVQLATPVQVAIAVVLPTIIAIAGLLVVQARTRTEIHERNNPVADPIFAILGTIYAVALAFMVVVGWQEYADAEKEIDEEATTLVNLYRDVRGLPDPVRTNVRTLIVRYTETVRDEEWALLARQQAHPQAEAMVDVLWQVLTDYEPATERQKAVYQEAFGKLNDLGKARELRILLSESSVPDLFWWLLYAGGVVTIGFTYFLGTPNRRAHLVMTGSLTLVVTSALYLTMVLDHPFTGDHRIEPVQFGEALELMEAASDERVEATRRAILGPR